MAEVDVVVIAAHAVEVCKVESEFNVAPRRGEVLGRKVRTANWEVSCATCGWRSPSRFQAKVAAIETGRDHQHAVRDTGVFWASLMGVDLWPPSDQAAQ